ncbi:MAG: ABC transporter ATP-binding protein [Myxococcota bacterium]
MPRIYAAGRRAQLWRLIANGMGQALLGVAIAGLLRVAVGSVETPRPPVFALAGLVLASAALWGLRVVEAGDAERLGQDYVTRVRLRLFDRLTARPVQAAGRYGLSMTRMIGDLNSLRNWVSLGIARAAVAGLTLVGLVGALLVIDPHLGGALASLVPLTGMAAAWVSRPLRQRVRETRRRRGRLASNLGEKLLAAATLRGLGRTRRELRRVRRQSERLRDAAVARARTAHALRALPAALLPMAIAVALAVAAVDGASAPDLVVAVWLGGMVAAALGELTRAWDYRLAFEEGRERIGDALLAPHLRESRDAIALPGVGPLAVEVESWAPPAGGPALSFRARAGETVLVSGPSGSGKSRLLQVLAGQHPVEDGVLWLDEAPLRRLRFDSVRESVGLVSPDLPLLRGSVLENLDATTADRDDPWLVALVAACGLGRDVLGLLDGLDTVIEEQGRNVPQSTRARISLARAAWPRPRLLLVDDPAFSLDARARSALGLVTARLEATTIIVGDEAHPPIPPDRIWRLAPRTANSPGATLAEERRHLDEPARRHVV